jgi:MFS superfamily sulfate permease-like transporter
MQRLNPLKSYPAGWLKYDLPAGLYVFFVALPLCLSIAIASGASPASGLLSGVVGGMLVATLSSSPLSVSGPAAGLTTIVGAAIVSSGDFRIFLLSVVLAGLFQIILGLLKLGSIANYFPSSVIKGMLAAIGIILVSNQIPIAIGYNAPDFWNSTFLDIFSVKQIKEEIQRFYYQSSGTAVLISIISISILVLYQFEFARKLRIVPAPLTVVIIGVLINSYGGTISPALSIVPTVNLPMNLQEALVFPDFTKLFNTEIIRNGIIIGMLASLETLLCLEAIDKLDSLHRITPLNRELVVQGIANMTCGLIGAIPVTAVIVRGAANVDAGAKSRLSAFIHGLLLLVTALAIPFLLNKIPNAVLAAILLITGYNLAKPKIFRTVFRLGWNQFLPFITTIIVILATDLLIGVIIGLILSIYFIVQKNVKIDYVLEEYANEHIFKLNKVVTFLNKVKIRDTLESLPPGSKVVIDGSQSLFVDYDVLEVISEFEQKAQRKNIEVKLVNIERVNVSGMH